MSESRARWLRRYAAAMTLGIGALLMPLLWFAAVRASMAGWTITLHFNELGEGWLEVGLLTLAVPVTWLGLIGFHELVRAADREVNADV